MEHYGFLSVLPPLVAVVLAIKYRNVLMALFTGTFIGTLTLANGNPIVGLTSMIKDYIFEQAAGGYNSSLLVMMVFIGGFVGVVTHSGGAAAFARKAANWFNTRAKAQIAVWLGGIAIFFSDSGNPLILGPTFQPITDKLRLSREKLAWLLDSTASPVCILIPFIGWGIYIMGLIKQEFGNLNMTEAPLTAFMKVIPFQFYAISTLLMIPLVAYLGFEFSAMYKAEKRTIEKGQPFWPEARPARPSVDISARENGVEPRASMMVIPLIVLFVCIFGLLIPEGFPFKKVSGSTLRMALCIGYFLGALACMFLMVRYKVHTAQEAFTMYMNGTKEIVFILMILVLAWSLGSVCKSLGTASYIVSITQGTLPGWMVPALVFAAGAGISFSTGSSWGTFAILMPLAIPMASALGAPLYASIGAVLSGGLFGDHCSPISDTTVLSSMGAACDHIDHVKTQLPYALTVGLASIIAYIIVGFTGTSAILGVALLLTVLLVTIFGKLWGSRMPNYSADEIEHMEAQGVEAYKANN
ncbi:MAG: sodium:proton exchanger [Synergistales bacterium]|nr:sodium:proton exchanger [Synergistales bacterium]